MDASDKHIGFIYDSQADVLYAYIGTPRPATSDEIEEDILIRRDPSTGEVFGFTIINYKRRKDSGKLHRIPHFEDVELPQ